jgi:hypothetical protein
MLAYYMKPSHGDIAQLLLSFWRADLGAVGNACPLEPSL